MKYLKSSYRVRGFTLIELTVVVAICAILAAVALPLYRSYVLKGHRVDAKDALVAIQLAQEKFRGNNLSYADSAQTLGLADKSTQGYYSLSVANATDTDYTATATVNQHSTQSADSAACPALSITQKGFVTDSTAACWGLK